MSRLNLSLKRFFSFSLRISRLNCSLSKFLKVSKLFLLLFVRRILILLFLNLFLNSLSFFSKSELAGKFAYFGLLRISLVFLLLKSLELLMRKR